MKWKRNLIKICLFISSYSLFFILFGILNFEKINKNIMNGVGFIVFVITIGTMVMLFTSKNGSKKIIIEKIDKSDDIIMNYIMTYIIPLVIETQLGLRNVIVYCSLITLLCFLYVKENMIYINPLFILLGYNIYRINDTIILITNYSYSDLKFMISNKNMIPGFYIENDIFISKKSK